MAQNILVSSLVGLVVLGALSMLLPWRRALGILALVLASLIGFVGLGEPLPLRAMEPSLYPPDTALTAVGMPPLARPGYLSSVVDPAFGTRLTRVADQAAMGLASPYLRHDSAKRQPWNSDGSLLLLEYPRALLDGRTYRYLGQVALVSEPVWANRDPRTMYGVSGNSFVRLDIQTGARTTLRQFPAYDRVEIGAGEGNLSNDDRYVVLNAARGGAYYGIVYDIAADAVLAERYLADYEYDWLTIAPSGRYVVANQRHYPADGGVYVYDLALNPLRRLAAQGEHGDVGLDAAGNDVYVQFDDTIAAWRLDSGAKATVVAGAQWGGHISCRNTQRPGWCYYSDQGGSAGRPGSNEAYAFALDGSGRVERFAHVRNGPDVPYDAQPHAVPNRAGTAVLFASGWDAPAPVYAYVAEWNDVTTSRPPPTATPASPPPANLALGKPATADSACVAGEGAARADDAAVANNSKWCSTGADKWWRVDLSAATAVGQVVIRHAGAGGEGAAWNTRDFAIQTSVDGTAWATVAAVTGNTADVTTHPFAAAQARYVRLNVSAATSTPDNVAARIYEVEVYAPSGTNAPPTATPVPPTATAAPGAGGTGLRGEYFNSRRPGGAPTATRLDARVDFDWGAGGPAPGARRRLLGALERPVAGALQRNLHPPRHRR